MSAGNMIFMRPNELVAHIKKNTRLLGIDLGSKTIGIAAVSYTHLTLPTTPYV